jgi:hypothetical protein
MTRRPEDVDRDLAALLKSAAPPAAPDPKFAERLRETFVAAASRGRRRRAFRPFLALLLAAAATFAVGRMIVARDARGTAPSFADAPRVEVRDRGDFGRPAARMRRDDDARSNVAYAADAACALYTDAPGVGRVEIDGVADLLLFERAAARYEPARPGVSARLVVGAGRVEARAEAPLQVEAADLRIAVHPGARVEIGVVPLGAKPMRNEILSAASGVVVGAVAVGLLLKSGDADLILPNGDPAALERGRASLLERPSVAEEAAAASRAAEDAAKTKAEIDALKREVADARAFAKKAEGELQKTREELAAMKSAAAAATIADVETVLGRLAELKKKGLSSLIDPSATAQVVADLKVLGEAGTKAMIDMLSDPDKESRFLAARILESLGDPAAVPALLAAALKEGESEMVTSQASHALALMDHPSVIEPCRTLYEKAPGDAARVNALFGWARHGDPAGVAEATRYVLDPKRPAAMRAAIGQGFLFLADDRAMAVADAYVDQNRGDSQIGSLAVSYYERINSQAARARLRSIADDPKVPQDVRNAANAALLK